MALSFGENLGVLGNIKLTDVKLVAGAFRTIASGSDTGSITVQRVEDGQIVYIQSEDRLIKASKAGATVNWSNFYFPAQSSGGETAGIFVATGSSFNTTNDLQITGSLTTTLTGSFGKILGDGSEISNLPSAAITTYSSVGDNRIVTSVNSTTVQGESNLTFNGAALNLVGSMTASGDISGSLTSTGSFGRVNATKFVGDGSGLTNVTSPITVKDEGSNLTTEVSSINFVGTGVSAVANGNDVTATIAGADLINVFENDSNGDLQPSDSNQGLSFFYEYDDNNDITLKA